MIKKTSAFLAITLFLSLTNCKKAAKTEEVTNSPETEATEITVENTVVKETPKLEALAEAIGDLDGDNVDEKAVVYNTDRSSENGIEREIHFFKKESDTWKLWKKTNEGILESKMGGVTGEPFRKITIEKGLFNIFHSGGSRSKWETENKYRFQNDNFELIGYTQLIDTPCTNQLLIDYNLSTGNAVLQKTNFKCNDAFKVISKKKIIDKKVNHTLVPLPNLNDGKSTDIITPLLKAAGEPSFFG